MELLDDLIANTNARVRSWRAIEYALRGPDVEELLIESSEGRDMTLAIAVNTGNLEAVQDWLRAERNKTFDNMSYTKLRDIAGSMKIYNYSRLSRWQLIAAIKAKEAARDKARAD